MKRRDDQRKLDHRPWRQILSTVGLVCIAIALLFWMMVAAPPPVQATDPTAANAPDGSGADLTVEISMDPAVPAPNQQVTINVLVSNIGTLATASNFRVYLYVDPADRPPTPSTAEVFSVGYPSLNAGRDTAFSRTHSFATQGCDHIIYVWVDRDNSVGESNENNNLIALPVCVGVTCAADSYENDNICSAAGWIAEGPGQARSLCHPDNPTTADTDWVKFTAFAGITYTLQTENAGIHAQGDLALYNACGGVSLVTPADKITWQAPESGVYYAALTQDAGAIGPLSAYSLTLASDSGLTDNYEPDNRCTTARDIATDGTRQSHLFQAPNDEDWIKFSVKAGESFIVIADNTATGVNPVVTLFDSCSQVAANASLAFAAQQVSAGSPTDRIYYARLANQNGANFGANAHYDLRVAASPCLPDSQEEDDNSQQAKSVGVGETARSHNFCPASDADWIKFSATAGKTYVLRTADLAFAADTVLTLYHTDGTTVITENDDYGYVSASRIVWTPDTTGDYYARITHVNPIANGPNTEYTFLIQEGYCQPDNQEGATGNNGPGDAALAPTNGISETHNFCADPLDLSLGDQDWIRINGVAGGNYQVVTTGLGPNSDPVLELYGSDGSTQLQSNDDVGEGRNAALQFTPSTAGPYFVRVRQYNSQITGNDASYQLQVFATEPPTPTPTPSPTPTPTPSPTPSPTPPPSTAETVILVNRARMTALYGAGKATALMDKLFALADDPAVNGLVLQVENDPAVAGAYTTWTANNSALLDHDNANNVIAAIRNRLLAFGDNAPDLKHVIIVGDDRMIPYRRVLDQIKETPQNAESLEPVYAPDVQDNGTIRAALAANMILTDDYLVDREPSQWEDKQHNSYELYLPDYATGRLVEAPDEIIAFIDNFLGGNKEITPNKVLVTGYDFVQDGANIIKTLYSNDTISTDSQLIAPLWPGDTLRTKYFAADPRFDIYAINGHSTHVAQGVPDENDITAAEVAAASTDLSGALIYSVGCHAGLNDPGVLDLPQAYMQKLAHYVGNTGFGWGGGGVVYTEAVMRNFSRELLRDTSASIGPALVAAKKKYYTTAQVFNAYDAKVLMQVTFYGLPMITVSSGGTLSDENPFPSTDPIFTPPTAFGDLAQGTVGYQLPGSFGAFGEADGSQGVSYNLDGNVTFAAGEPLQPQYYANVSAPAAGELRGVVFIGGVYSDVVSFDPVVALADNEYITNEAEPTFTSPTFYPRCPSPSEAVPMYRVPPTPW
ncbi:MAG: CARDB domain-containing protein [Caldilineaceae bacterium]